MEFDEPKLRSALDKAWSLETSKQWSKENPGNGQCNVTSVVIFDLFGGEIFRTRYPTFWHYYNCINGRRYDLSDSQFVRPGARFDAPENYEDVLSTREAAMEGIPQREYDALMKGLLRELS